MCLICLASWTARKSTTCVQLVSSAFRPPISSFAALEDSQSELSFSSSSGGSGRAKETHRTKIYGKLFFAGFSKSSRFVPPISEARLDAGTL